MRTHGLNYESHADYAAQVLQSKFLKEFKQLNMFPIPMSTYVKALSNIR